MPVRPRVISRRAILQVPGNHVIYPIAAARRSLSTSSSSTVHAGTTYETLVQQSLIPLAFTLSRVGGRSDHGIDLQGHWCPPSLATLPPTSSREDNNKIHHVDQYPRLRIPAIVQCKSHASRPQPPWVRELSGALPFAPLHLQQAGDSSDGVIGVLACKGALTAGVREAVMKSERGLVWCQVSGEGRIEGMMWNAVVGKMVEGLGVGFVYKVVGNDGRMGREMRLMMDGRVWESGERSVRHE